MENMCRLSCGPAAATVEAARAICAGEALRGSDDGCHSCLCASCYCLSNKANRHEIACLPVAV
jgi:hypothetical protein